MAGITLSELLKKMIEMGGSDLHLTTNSSPRVRVHGKLRPIDMAPLSAADTKSLAYSVLTDAQKHRFEENLELETVLLGVGEHAISQRLGIGRAQWRHVDRAQLAVDPDPRRAVGGEVQVAAAHLDHFFEQFAQRNAGHNSPLVTTRIPAELPRAWSARRQP